MSFGRLDQTKAEPYVSQSTRHGTVGRPYGRPPALFESFERQDEYALRDALGRISDLTAVKTYHRSAPDHERRPFIDQPGKGIG